MEREDPRQGRKRIEIEYQPLSHRECSAIYRPAIYVYNGWMDGVMDGGERNVRGV